MAPLSKSAQDQAALTQDTRPVLVPKTVHFRVPVKPVPKARPQVNLKTGTVYTPPTTVAYEEDVSTYAAMAWVPHYEPGTPLLVTLSFYTDGVDVVIETAEASAISQGDLDNLVKSTLDGLSGYFNDRQVVQLWATKSAGKVPLPDGDAPERDTAYPNRNVPQVGG